MWGHKCFQSKRFALLLREEYFLFPFLKGKVSDKGGWLETGGKMIVAKIKIIGRCNIKDWEYDMIFDIMKENFSLPDGVNDEQLFAYARNS